jgi:hypothetical protein
MAASVTECDKQQQSVIQISWSETVEIGEINETMLSSV